MTPQKNNLKIDFTCQFQLTLPDTRLSTLLSVFTVLLPTMLGDFIQKVLIGYGELLMACQKKPFSCERCGNDERFIWKTRHGKPTKVLTTLTWVTLRHLQVQCSCCGHKFSITRMLLGLDPYQRIAPEIRRKLGLLGSLTTFRVAELFMKTFGAVIDKMTIGGRCRRRAKRSRFPWIPRGSPEERPMARALAFGGSRNEARS